MSGNPETTPVEVITQHCRYTGLLATRGQRVSDILSDSHTDILEMQETLTNVVGTGATEVRWKQLYLKKAQILMVIPQGNYEAPARRRNKYVEKPRYGAMMVLPGNVMSGILHLPARTTPQLLMLGETSLPGFMGMTDVTVHNSIHGLGASHFGVLIFRRSSIESVQLTARPLPQPEAVGETAEAEVLSP